jgi:tripartite-type tricarboxylate transporter receptor subunit TctC
MQDVMAGNAQLTFASLPSAIAGAQSGKVRIIAVTSPKRAAALPNIPTVMESGLAGYEVETWYGVFTTGGTPAAVVQRLASEIGQVVNQPAVREAIAKLGMEAAPSTPDEFAHIVQHDMERWGKVVRTVGIKVD